MVSPDTRRAALIATVVTVPLVLIAALLFAGGGNDPSSAPPSTSAPLAAVSVAAPQSTSAADVSTCAQVISGLPLTLAGSALRRTVSNPPSPSIVAWGDPAIVLRCGVARPKALNPSLIRQLIEVDHAVLVLPTKIHDATVFTVVNKAVFIDLTVPSSYAQPPLGPVVVAIQRALPADVCGLNLAGPTSKLCTRRP